MIIFTSKLLRAIVYHPNPVGPKNIDAGSMALSSLHLIVSQQSNEAQ